MKDNFSLNEQLLHLEEALKAKQPIAMMVVSTTGVKDDDMPFRIQVKQYEYDETIGGYINSTDAKFDTNKGFTFNECVAVPDDIIDRAAQDTSYDVFKGAECTADEYKSGTVGGKAVMSRDDFARAFQMTMNALVKDNTVIMVDADFASKMLAKIDCKLPDDSALIIDNSAIRKEFVEHKGVTAFSRVSFNDVRDVLRPLPASFGQFAQDGVKDDFANMDKTDFLKKYSGISEKMYEVYVDRQAALNATERIGLLKEMVEDYGREKGLVQTAYQQRSAESKAQNHQIWSDNGKKQYANAPIHKKLTYFVEKGFLDVNAVQDGTSNYHQMMQAITGENGKSHIAFVHTATTGVEDSKPLKLFATVYDVDPATHLPDFKHPHSFKAVFPNDYPSDIMKAVEGAKKKGIELFVDAELDEQLYFTNKMRNEDGKAVKIPSIKTVQKNIDAFFTPELLADCTIISAGSADDGRAFFQNALNAVCKTNLGNADFVDFLAVQKEYAYGVEEGIINPTQEHPALPQFETQGFTLLDASAGIGKPYDKAEFSISKKIMAMAKTAYVLGKSYECEKGYVTEQGTPAPTTKVVSGKATEEQAKADAVLVRGKGDEAVITAADKGKDGVQVTGTANVEGVMVGSPAPASVSTPAIDDEEGSFATPSESKHGYEDAVTDAELDELADELDEEQDEIEADGEDAFFESILSGSEADLDDDDLDFVPQEVLNATIGNGRTVSAQPSAPAISPEQEQAMTAVEQADAETEKVVARTEVGRNPQANHHISRRERPSQERGVVDTTKSGVEKVELPIGENGKVKIPVPDFPPRGNVSITNDSMWQTLVQSLLSQNERLAEQNNLLSNKLVEVVAQNERLTEQIVTLANNALQATREQNVVAKAIVLSQSNLSPEQQMALLKDENPEQTFPALDE